jgi:outer membrane protein assembly factor BamB
MRITNSFSAAASGGGGRRYPRCKGRLALPRDITGELTMTRTRNLMLATVVACAAFAGAASAQTLVALSGDATLTSFDSKTLAAGPSMPIKGVSGRVAGIDMRPADGMLYAVSADGSVYTVDAKTGQATMKVKLETFLPANAKATVDFNPAADRLRIIGSDGTSLRANVDDGKVIKDGSLKYAEGDKAAGKTPMVTAGAYSNSVKGTKETALYDIDSAMGTFLKQAPPNDGVLTTMGSLGVKAETIAFDIATDATGRNTGFAVVGDALHTIDIASGAATMVGKVKGLPSGVRDVAVIAP